MKRGRGSEKDEIVDLEYEALKARTVSAALFVFGGKDVWLPFSQIEIDEEQQSVTMPEWLAFEKGLI